MKVSISVCFWEDQGASVAEVKQNILDVSTDNLVRMQEGGGLTDNQNLTTIWIQCDSSSKVILPCIIKSPMSGEPMRAVTWLDLLKEYIKCVWVSCERRLFSMSRYKYLLAIGCDHGLRNHDGGCAPTGRDRAECVGVGGRTSEGHPHYLEDSSQRIYWINVLRCID